MEGKPGESIVKDKNDNYKVQNSDKNLKKYRKEKQKTNKRKVKLNSNGNIETLLVTHKVKIQKQKITCTLNVKKNISSKQKSNADITKPKLTLHPNQERTIPQCLRKCCMYVHTRNCYNNYRLQNKEKIKSKKHLNRSKKPHKMKLKSPADILSPIWSSPEVYSDISSDSFSDYSKRYIDTLIKRTKERERQRHFSELQPKINVEDTSDVETVHLTRCDSPHSFVSTNTFILEPKLGLYSPSSCNGLSKDFNEKDNTETVENRDNHELENCYLKIKEEIDVKYSPEFDLADYKETSDVWTKNLANYCFKEQSLKYSPAIKDCGYTGCTSDVWVNNLAAEDIVLQHESLFVFDSDMVSVKQEAHSPSKNSDCRHAMD